jgi:hypothetical protein
VSSRVNIPKSVNRLLVPRLLELGFTIVGNEDGKGWREGRSFERVKRKQEQGIFFGRHKFGRALGLTLARQREDGSFEYLDVKQRLPREVLQYEGPAELDLVVERLRQFIDEEAIPWLDGPVDSDVPPGRIGP